MKTIITMTLTDKFTETMKSMAGLESSTELAAFIKGVVSFSIDSETEEYLESFLVEVKDE